MCQSLSRDTLINFLTHYTWRESFARLTKCIQNNFFSLSYTSPYSLFHFRKVLRKIPWKNKRKMFINFLAFFGKYFHIIFRSMTVGNFLRNFPFSLGGRVESGYWNFNYFLIALCDSFNIAFSVQVFHFTIKIKWSTSNISTLSKTLEQLAWKLKLSDSVNNIKLTRFDKPKNSHKKLFIHFIWQ